MPVARNLEASPPSLLQAAEARRQRVKLVGWLFCGLIVLFALFSVLSWTVWEVLGLFVGVPRPRAVKEKPVLERVLPNVASDKLVSMVDEATAGLQLWTSAATGNSGADENLMDTAARLSAELTSLDNAVTALQESLAKSRSVGSVVGLVTLDNDKAQALLKADQAAVVEQSGQVHALAGRIYQEHEEYQSRTNGRSGGDAAAEAEDDSTGFQRRASEEQELMNKLDYGLGEASPEGMWARLQEVEANVDAGVPIEDAEVMVARYAAIAADRAGGEPQERSDAASDEDIARIVEEIVLRVDAPSPPESCISVELAQTITKTELERYGADRTGIPDYAMGPAGARVILGPGYTSDTYEAPMGFMERMMTSRRKDDLKAVSQPPVAINPESRLGMCWPMKGSLGRLTVRLSEAINVKAISIEHGARELLLNKGISALKDFTVVGYPKGARIADENGHELVSGGEYRLEGDVIQFFDIADKYLQVEYDAVTLQVHSNHGEGLYTCIYRLRVHGAPTRKN